MHRLSRTVIGKVRRQRRLGVLLSNKYGLKARGRTKINVQLVLQEGRTHPKSSAFIRLISPLTYPGVADKVSLRLLDGNSMPKSKCDICIVQRTAIDSLVRAEKLVNKMKSNGTKLVLDTDDAFHQIDKTHPEYETQVAKVEALDHIVKNADQIWASTEKIANHFSTTHNEVKVFANSLDPRVWKPDLGRRKRSNSDRLEILYMGTSTHDADLAMVLPALDRLEREHPGSFRVTLIGVASRIPDKPWLHKLSQQISESIYPGFVSWYLQQGPFDVGLAPLVGSEFNSYKSDIKCLDYLAAGILPLVSDVEAYSNKDLDKFIVRVKNSSEAWYRVLSEYAENTGKLRKKKDSVAPAINKYLWSKRSVEYLAPRLLSDIEKLLDKPS